MNITKFGHCCLLVEINGVRALFDPGVYATGQDDLHDVDMILITHEHTDHYHIESLKKILDNNPNAVVITNDSVGKLLQKEGIVYKRIADGESTEINVLKVEGFGSEHALIYGEMGACENTGYLIAEKFYFAGDSFYIPDKAVEVLALPVDAPWMKVAEAVDYAKKIHPRIAFPVHDAMQTQDTNEFYNHMFARFLTPEDIIFSPFKAGETKGF